MAWHGESRYGVGALAGLAALVLTAAPAHAAWKPGPPVYGVAKTANLPIRMADGTVLRADVYTPADPRTGRPAARRFPVLLTETAYGKDAMGALTQSTSPTKTAPVLAVTRYLVSRGYVGVIADVRGTGGSGGAWAFNEPVEARDSTRVISWAARLPHANRRVGMVGESYMGLTQLFAAAAERRGSPLKAIFPMAVSSDTFREALLPGGLLDSEGLGAYIGLTATLNLANPLIEESADLGVLRAVLGDHAAGIASFHVQQTGQVLLDGPNAYESAYWRARAPDGILPRVVRNRIPAYLVGGLYDLFQNGEPLDYAELQNAWSHRPVHAPMAPRQRVTGRYQLLTGPWYHSTLGSSHTDLNSLQLAWFDRWLKGRRTGIDRTRTPLHAIDPDGRRFGLARYPTPAATPAPLFLGAGGTLSRRAPAATGGDPVVFTGASLPCDRTTEQWALGLPATGLLSLGLTDPCAEREIPQAAGPAQIAYTTPAFPRATVLAGPIAARLFVTATTRDTELIVKLSDVAPDGSSRELSEGELLGSMRRTDPRRSWRAPGGRPLVPYPTLQARDRAPVRPGAVTRYDIGVGPVFATLARGHRLRVRILTGETPHLLAPPRAIPDLVGGVYRVLHGPGQASLVELPLTTPARLHAPGRRA